MFTRFLHKKKKKKVISYFLSISSERSVWIGVVHSIHGSKCPVV